MSAILFSNARLIDGGAPEAREGFHLLVEGDRIKEIADTPITPPAGARVIDLKGGVLMPGLIDCHVHVKAYALNFAEMGDAPAAYVFAQAAAIMRGMLQRGFTSVRDAAGAERGLADGVAQGLIEGPRLFVCGLALSQTGGHSDQRPFNEMSQASAIEAHNQRQHFGRIADGVDECRRAARDELRKGADHVKIMAGGGVSSPSDPIENTQYSMEELTAICQEAAAWRTYAMAHTYTPEAISMAVRAGVRTVEHCNLIDRETAALVAQKGAYHVPTNITYWALNKHGREFGFPDVSIEKLQTIVEAGLGAVALTEAAGAKIAFGTDLLGPCHRYQANEFSLLAEVLGHHGAIKAATETAAEVVQQSGEIGVLAMGAKADLIVVDGDPLSDIGVLENDGARIPLVMKDGKIFKDRLSA